MSRFTKTTPTPPPSPTSATAAPGLPSPKERRRLREAKALSQLQVAAIVGVTRQTVRSWETGRTSPRGRKREVYARLLAGIAEELATKGEATPVRTATPEPPHGERTEQAGPPESTAPTTPTTRSVSTAPSAPSAPSAPIAPSAPATPSISAGPSAPAAPSISAGPPAPAAPSASSAPSISAAPSIANTPAAPTEPTAPSATTPPSATSTSPSPVPVSAPTPAPAPSLTPTRTPTPAELDALVSGPSAEPAPTPSQAFDSLYAHTAPSLLRQAYLLTGRHRLSHESVERAFHLAWQRWPEVATDRDPTGWVRAAAYEYAMSPWHRLRRGHRHIDPPSDGRTRGGTGGAGGPRGGTGGMGGPGGGTGGVGGPRGGTGSTPGPDTGLGQRALLLALLELPPPYRRTLLLYDGLGLDLPETAAETEASTPATANRLEHARTVVARKLPELAEVHAPAARSALLQERLSSLAMTQSADALPPGNAVRTRSERRTRFWTRAAIAFTTLIIGATAFTLSTAPTQYESPRPPGEPVGGVPAHSGPQRLSAYDKQLRAKLRAEPENGPQRLVPQSR